MLIYQITTLDPTLQKNLVASLELGLTNIGVDTVYTLCCDFIQVSKTSYYQRFENNMNTGARMLHGATQTSGHSHL